jgi:hypothetical protein
MARTCQQAANSGGEIGQIRAVFVAEAGALTGYK